MKIFDAMREHGHEQLIFCSDKKSKLRALIAIHDTSLGPALGGCRMWPYKTEDEAIQDALRLARGMTYKSAAAGSNYGGGKSVVWGDSARDKTETLFRALGRFVQTLDGRFITGTDVGTSSTDFIWARAETKYVVALPEEFGGSGDTSIITAYGVWHGIRACARFALGAESLAGRTVAVQGLGKVGHKLVEHLCEEGAHVTVTDIDPAKVASVRAAHPGVAAVAPDAIYDVDCEIYSPNALGATINDQTLPRLKCRIVAGGANNQLAELRHGDALHERGILYAPDYVINGGGAIQAAEELGGFNRDRALRRAAGIHGTLLRIFAIARDRGIPTYRAADVMAEERIAEVGHLRLVYTPPSS
jgi:leucine dehydrogenase